MANIDDLKNDGNVKKPFIPTLEQTPSNEPFIPSIEGGETPEPPKKKGSIRNSNVLSMTSGKPKDNRQNRQKADFSDLPEAEVPGVNLKNSMTEDILGPGGIFDEYVERMQKEATEYYAEEEFKKEIGDDGADADDDLFGEESDTVEETNSDDDLEAEYVEDTSKSYKNIDLFAEEEDEEMDNVMEEQVVEEAAPVAEEPVVETVKETVAEDIEEDSKEIKIDREIVTNDFDDDDDDLDDDEESVESDADDEQIEALRAMISERLRPVSKKMDISGFTIASKPSLSNNIIVPKEVPVAKWALPNTGVCIHIKEILGSNLEKIRTFIQNNNIRSAFQIIYDNIVSEKPASLEAWMKSIAFEDYDHIFFAIYIASFTDSNFIPITCPEASCKNSFITENLPMSQLVKFENEESEKKFKKLLASDVVNSKGLVPSEIIPISDNFAFGFVLPSLYNILIESSYLDSEFSSKYSNAVAITPYIDKIYFIDKEHNQLTPVGYKEFANNKAKTVKSKVVRYDKVLSTLETDEIALVRAYISKIVKDNASGVSYQIPATTCTKCGKEIPASPMEASAMVFTRNQLGLLMNI